MQHVDQIPADLIKGAMAGALATWVMGRVTAHLYEQEDPAARRAEDEARGGQTAFAQAAEKSAEVVGIELPPEQRQKAGQAVHWALGIGTGAVYAVLRRQIEQAEWAQGLGFGTAFWLLVDEALVPALGLAPGPTAFPWQTHVRGWFGHLSFGLVVDTALDAMDRIV